MKKRLLHYFFALLLILPASGFAQETDLRQKAVRFFVNNLDRLPRKGVSIVPEFLKHNNKSIFYWFSGETLDLTTILYDARKKDDKFMNQDDRVMFVADNVNARYTLSMPADSNNLSAAKPYDITLSVSEVLQDVEFSYVLLRFKSVGPLESFYTGNMLCKFNNRGALVKYSYAEL